jgi:hypothetical protein
MVGDYVNGTGVAFSSGAGFTKITALGSGTGGTGTYTVNISQTVASTAMTAAGNPANIRFEHLLFTSSTVRSNGATLAVRNGFNIELDDIIFGANQAIGLDLHGGAGATFQNQYGYYIRKVRGFSGLIGMRVGAESQVADLYFSESNFGNMTLAGVNVQSVSGFYSSRNDAQANATAWLVNPGNGQGVTAVFSNADILDTSIGDGLVISPTGTGVVVDNSWTNFWSATHGGNGIVITGNTANIRNNGFSNCRIINNRKHGVDAQAGGVDFADCGVMDNSIGSGTYTGSISGTTLTITAIAPTSSQLVIGETIAGAGIAPNTGIVSLGTGTGGVGTYIVNNSQTVASTSIAGTQTGVYSGYAFAAGASNFSVNGGRAGKGSGPNTGLLRVQIGTLSEVLI